MSEKQFRASSVFAAYRSQLQAELSKQIAEELVPSFNAAIINIEKEREELLASTNDEHLVKKTAHASVVKLCYERNQKLQRYRDMFMAGMEARAAEMGAEIIHEKEIAKQKDGKEQPYNAKKAVFPDKSKAHFHRLWIPFALFNQLSEIQQS